MAMCGLVRRAKALLNTIRVALYISQKKKGLAIMQLIKLLKTIIIISGLAQAMGFANTMEIIFMITQLNRA